MDQSSLTLTGARFQGSRLCPQVHLSVSWDQRLLIMFDTGQLICRTSGGQLSSVHTLVSNIQDAGLNVNSIEDIGPREYLLSFHSHHSLLCCFLPKDYARTLREWGYRWKRNFESHIRPTMKRHYPELSELDLDIFNRKFECEYALIFRRSSKISSHPFSKITLRIVRRALRCVPSLIIFSR